jgi:NAD(P)H-dependent FMN reductase
MKIEIISGSPSHKSITHRLALHLQKQLSKDSTHEVGIIDLRDFNLSTEHQVFASPAQTPEAFKDLSEKMFAADAYVLVTPEYNGSYTARLKSFLDHFPKQQHKAFAIVTGSPGALGGIRAAMQLQQLIFALFGIGSPYMLITPAVDKKFNEAGELLDPSFEKSVQLFIHEFLWLAEKLA